MHCADPHLPTLPGFRLAWHSVGKGGTHAVDQLKCFGRLCPHYSLIRSRAAISPTTPRRNSSTHATKMMP